MKILLCADLHSNRSWYDWLVGKAGAFDVIAVAGDLLDIFSIDPAGQIGFLRAEWLPAMIATGTPVAVSSGNHDGDAIMWLAYIGDHNAVVGDGSTKLVTARSGEPLVITTCPHYRSYQENDPETIALWREGSRLRDLQSAPWLVLHHEPPTELAEPGTITSHWLKQRISEYNPDFVACGHFHRGAAHRFGLKIGDSWCFNGGQHLDAPRPHHIILDTRSGVATRVRMQRIPGALSWVERRDEMTLP